MMGRQNTIPERPHEQWSMTDILDVMCPMHLVLNKTGHIVHVGPTLGKIRTEPEWLGKRFLVDVSRFSAAPYSHLSGHSFEIQGAFPT